MKRNDRGSAAVEMALLMPVLLMVVFATIDFGRMYNAQITLTEAARDGARAAVLGADATAQTKSAAPGLKSVTVGITACPATPTPGADAVVVATYPFQFITPLSIVASALFKVDMKGNFNLTGQGRMSCL